jgi:PBP1b-binding outer membrane lipoprotein LpoB
MKTLKYVSVAVMVLLVSSCATEMHFPVSSVAPAADITLTKKLDRNNNFRITLTARNLAAVERIAPDKTTYVAWIVTTTGEIKNVGQLNVSNARKAVLKTITSFDFNEAFITAEEQGDVPYPYGLEIARVTSY